MDFSTKPNVSTFGDFSNKRVKIELRIRNSACGAVNRLRHNGADRLVGDAVTPDRLRRVDAETVNMRLVAAIDRAGQ